MEAQGEMKIKMCLSFSLMRKGNTLSWNGWGALTGVLANLARRSKPSGWSLLSSDLSGTLTFS